jgi:hypothetical protein
LAAQSCSLRFGLGAFGDKTGYGCAGGGIDEDVEGLPIRF